MRFVLSPDPIGSSIEPVASRTRTISSGTVVVVDVFDVEDRAERTVRKSEPGAFLIVRVSSLSIFESVISVFDSVLSVQMRPTFFVSLSYSKFNQEATVELSTMVSSSPAALVCSSFTSPKRFAMP